MATDVSEELAASIRRVSVAQEQWLGHFALLHVYIPSWWMDLRTLFSDFGYILTSMGIISRNWLWLKIVSWDDWRECWKCSRVCSVCRATVRKTTEMLHWHTRRYETGVKINRLTYHEQRSMKPVGVYSNIHLGMRLPSFIMNVVRCL